MIFVIFLLLAIVVQGKNTKECTVKALKKQDLNLCYDNITSQFPWETSVFNANQCYPKEIYMLYDISNTIRRSGEEKENSKMLKIQEEYIKTFINLFQTNETYYNLLKESDASGFAIHDTFSLIGYATKAQLLTDFTVNNQSTDFFEILSDVEAHVNADEDLKKFYFGNHRGWSQVSNAFSYVLDDLELTTELFDENNHLFFDKSMQTSEPLVVLMTDGKPESRIGMTREARFMRRYARFLKKKYNAHIHCVVMRFSTHSKGFWRKQGTCDSKQLLRRVDEVTAANVNKGLEALQDRKQICETYSPPTLAPTLSPSTLEPTLSPSISPTVKPTFGPTQSPIEPCSVFEETNLLRISDMNIAESDITMNNLGGFCGTEAVFGETCGPGLPEHVRYTNVFQQDGQQIDLIMKNVTDYFVKPRTAISGVVNHPIGISGAFGEVSMRKASNVTLRYEFRNQADQLVTIGALDFTVFDLDQEGCSCNECACLNCEFREALSFDNTQFQGTNTSFVLFQNENSLLCKSEEGSSTVFKSTQLGTIDDNPDSPNSLTQFASDVSVLIRLFDVSSFEINYKIQGGSLLGGRRMLFAGASNVHPCQDRL